MSVHETHKRARTHTHTHIHTHTHRYRRTRSPHTSMYCPSSAVHRSVHASRSMARPACVFPSTARSTDEQRTSTSAAKSAKLPRARSSPRSATPIAARRSRASASSIVRRQPLSISLRVCARQRAAPRARRLPRAKGRSDGVPFTALPTASTCTRPSVSGKAAAPRRRRVGFRARRRGSFAQHTSCPGWSGCGECANSSQWAGGSAVTRARRLDSSPRACGGSVAITGMNSCTCICTMSAPRCGLASGKTADDGVGDCTTSI